MGQRGMVEPERVPMYWAWTHLNPDFRLVLVDAGLKACGMAQVYDANILAVADWPALPPGVRQYIMGRVRECSAIVWRDYQGRRHQGRDALELARLQ